MRRADRLFRIIQLLRGRRGAVTARWIAEELEVSERTVYRDIRDLITNGTPIEGEAGVGYTLRSGYDLPPLMFDEEEIQALALGARVVAAFGDDQLARAAGRVLDKIEAVIPERLEGALEGAALFAPRLRRGAEMSASLVDVRLALGEKRKIHLRYGDAEGERSERVVRPLGAFFWGHAWTLSAWCELRDDFRNFRLDRIRSLELGDCFEDEEGKTLRDYLRTMGPDAESMLDR
ncbi:MAG: YafY family transcriptional regulator [Deltaproteobacteria bacterium]|nr:YafY family transcriptional regulator [Deltaproteobacteria bacterium]